ncbi:nucleotidyltransferase family protein [Methanoplanus limicola]|uniref:protein adenylyltransferase n=1 Tax=Methanoplanus limicola DSM 2279 TaxID=937775 RepID=H1Z1G5_9EURY|nr:nucleotidyltransferase family protein [Methanoplanus limicola]EHQ36312.1 DNA polymerase beta domain protein region [Methanoplanus limicola DSM 2279]
MNTSYNSKSTEKTGSLDNLKTSENNGNNDNPLNATTIPHTMSSALSHITSPINLLIKYEAEIFQKFGVLRIGIFGSCARGTDTPKSDVDVFVEFREGEKTFDNYMELKFYPESIFERSVDLVTYDGLNPHIRDDVMSEVVYVA